MLENNTMKPFNNNCCNNSYCNNSWDNCCNNSWDKYRPPKYCISYCNVPIMNRQLGYTYNTCSRPQPFTSYTWHIQQPHNHLQQLRNHLQQPHNHIQLNKYNKYEKKNCGCGK